jgi:hypothetical protein
MPSRIQHWNFKWNMYYYRLRTKNNNSYKEIMIPLKVDMSLSTIQQHNQAEKRALKLILNGSMMIK